MSPTLSKSLSTKLLNLEWWPIINNITAVRSTRLALSSPAGREDEMVKIEDTLVHTTYCDRFGYLGSVIEQNGCWKMQKGKAAKRKVHLPGT